MTTTQDTIRAAAYQRISRDMLGDEHGIANQAADQERAAAARGYVITLTASDNDISALNGKYRPGYQKVMAAVKRGEVDVVLVFQTSRFWRNRKERAEGIEILRKAGVSLIATRGPSFDMSTAYGRAMAGLLGEFDTMESEVKGERQKLANQQAAEAGKARRGSPRPFGWAADRITLDPAEAAAIRDACGMLLAGGTISAVIRDWDARGVRPLQGEADAGWSRTSVRLILSNPRNAGIATYHKTEVGRGEWEPVVAEETYRAVCDVLAANRAGRKKVAGRTMLGMLGRCRCGAPVTGSWSGDGRRPAYRCHHLSPQRGEGPHVFVRRDLIDEWVGALVTERLSRPDAAGLLAAPAAADTAGLRDEAAALRERLARLGALFAAGTVSEQDLVSGRAAGEARLEQIAAVLAEAGRESVLAPLVAADDVAAAWERLDVSLKRAAVAALMTVTLVPPGRGAHTWDPADVVRVEWVPSRR